MKTKVIGSSVRCYFSVSSAILRSRVCQRNLISRNVLALCASLLLSACGGGGGGGSDGGGPPLVDNSGWQAGVFQPSTNFAARCANPRTGIDPYTGSPYPDRSGSITQENSWLRSWTHELYLWYREVTDRNPASYNNTADYFALLKTTQTTASGQPKDKFHFTYPTAVWRALSQGGVQAGYGAEWAIVEGAPPRDVRVAYIASGSSPASMVTLARGAKLLAIDGIDVVNTNSNAQIDAINDALYPDATGQSHTFTVLDVGTSVARAVTMTSANITSTPVQNVRTISTGSGLVGYMQFNDHIATSEVQLINAIRTLSQANVTDLVLDIRYNGGGYLDIASELAYMIAGPTQTAGKTFETMQFNDQYSTTNPVTGAPLAPVPFHSTTQDFSVAAGQALPTLNLARVYVLTGEGTCSASEAIINGLRGIDVQVIQIGSMTCGKPYGFYDFDNCGTTYFSIQFRSVNQKGFGDYSDGFAPSNSAGIATTPLPGCSVGDDFTRALGDVAEARLAAALNYRASATCPAASGIAQPSIRFAAPAAGPVLVAPESPLHNRILR